MIDLTMEAEVSQSSLSTTSTAEAEHQKEDAQDVMRAEADEQGEVAEQQDDPAEASRQVSMLQNCYHCRE